tara:strand:+ start:1361 stop:2308 length:948 start_codon:yes stop_codon:yes gene_type:complete
MKLKRNFIILAFLAGIFVLDFEYSFFSRFRLARFINSSVVLDSKNKQNMNYPVFPRDNIELVNTIINAENSIRNPSAKVNSLKHISHQQQVIYRRLSKNPKKAELILSLLPKEISEIAAKHIYARQQFLEMRLGKPILVDLPAWEIIYPEPPESLISYYKHAEELSGVDWEVLAAINLVESGMGRISGKSIANAQGPMQFLPTTWSEPGVGLGGDINNPEDSIHAASRYLVKRGYSISPRKALWGYNNSENYVNAVLTYASLIKQNPLAFLGLYYWEIHYQTIFGDIWLPIGYQQKNSISTSSYIKKFPASAPPD